MHFVRCAPDGDRVSIAVPRRPGFKIYSPSLAFLHSFARVQSFICFFFALSILETCTFLSAHSYTELHQQEYPPRTRSIPSSNSTFCSHHGRSTRQGLSKVRSISSFPSPIFPRHSFPQSLSYLVDFTATSLRPGAGGHGNSRHPLLPSLTCTHPTRSPIFPLACVLFLKFLPFSQCRRQSFYRLLSHPSGALRVRMF